jgi:large subunit ribosomal protein L6
MNNIAGIEKNNKNFLIKFKHIDKVINYSSNDIKTEFKLFKKKITLNGLGFKVERVDSSLIFSLGYSSKKLIGIPVYISNIKINKNSIVLESNDSVLLGNFCSEICNLRVPNVYKLKGLILEGSSLIKKEVKKK